MADEGTEAEGSTSNGVSGSSDSYADARSAFLAMTGGEEAAESKPAAKAPAKSEDADDDSDLDDEIEAAAESDDDEIEASEDDDSDLDEEDEEADEKPDADTAKRLAAVQRTEKRMREQLKKDRAAMEAEFEAKAKDYEARVHAEIERWKPRVEAAEKFERAAERINHDPIGVLKALGLKPERYEHAASSLYHLAKSKDDPKSQAAVAQIIRDGETNAKLDELQKWREEREKLDKERETADQKRAAEAKAREDGQRLLDSYAKAASDKTPLAKTYLKSDPDGAREAMARIAMKLWDDGGKEPDPRAVMVAFEKERRGLLRKMGIDPKKLSATAANAAIEKSETKTAPKKGDKTVKPSAKTDDSKPFTKDDFINGKYD